MNQQEKRREGIITVTLTAKEMLAGATAGCARRIANILQGVRGHHDVDKSGQDLWAVDAMGGCGEVAAAKALNRFWNMEGERWGADVGHNIEVKSVTSERAGNDPHLIISKATKQEVCMLVDVRSLPVCRVLGWILTVNAKTVEANELAKEKLRNGEDNYMVPWELLKRDWVNEKSAEGKR